MQNKGEKPFEFNNYAKFLFSANSMPRIRDKTGAVLRRLLIVPFNAQFSAKDADYDSDIKYKLYDAAVMEYLINIGLAALKNVLQNKCFTTSDRVEEQLKEYEEVNNPIIGFFKECEEEGFRIENNITKNVYLRYKEYCLANSLTPMSNVEFSRQVCKKMGLESKQRKINGKIIRIYEVTDR